MCMQIQRKMLMLHKNVSAIPFDPLPSLPPGGGIENPCSGVQEIDANIVGSYTFLTQLAKAHLMCSSLLEIEKRISSLNK